MNLSSLCGAALESDGSGNCEILASHSLSEPGSLGLEDGGYIPHFTLRLAEPMCEELGDKPEFCKWPHRSTRPQGKDPAGASDCTAPK